MTGKKNNDELQNKETEVTDDDDFVMTERNGEIIAGGFRVNSLLLKHNQSPMHTLNQQMQGGGPTENVSDVFKDLAIPAGIFYQPTTTTKSGGYRLGENVVEEEDVDDDLYDKLVKLASVSSQQNSSAREKKGQKITKSARSKNMNKQKFTKKIRSNKIK